AKWQPLTDLLPNLAVSALLMDPANPDVIYAGTGEFILGASERQLQTLGRRGAGIFKTVDGGMTWVQLTSTNTPDFYYVNDIAISPLDSRRLYAATRTGVWQSRDGGASWSQALKTPTPSDSAPVGWLNLAMPADTTSEFVFPACGLFASDFPIVSTKSTVYRNVDAAGGGQWEVVLRENGMGRTTLALAPSDQNIIYALSSYTGGGAFQDGLYAVFRSTSFGNPGT